MNVQDQKVLDYSPAAEQVLALARLEAGLLNHEFVATEHLLKKPEAANPAGALRLTIADQRRRFADLGG